MDRHTVRHRRPPACIRARIEHPVKPRAHDPAACVCADLHGNLGRVPFGRTGDAFGAGIGHAHRLSQFPRRQRNIGLRGQVQFRSEPAADRRGQNAHRRRVQPQNTRQRIAVHIGRLRAALHLDPVAHPAGAGRFGFDIAVFDEPRGEIARDHMRRLRQRRIGIAARNKPATHHVVRAVGMQQRRRVGPRGRQLRRAFVPVHRKGTHRIQHIRTAHHGGNRFALEPRLGFGKDRLVDEPRNDAKQVRPRHVTGGQDQVQPVFSPKRLKITKPEPGAVKR